MVKPQVCALHFIRSRREVLDSVIKAINHAANPATGIRSSVTVTADVLSCGDNTFHWKDLSSIQVLGAGKAACAMADTFVDIIYEHAVASETNLTGHVVTKYNHSIPSPYLYSDPAEKSNQRCIQVSEAAHPVPDAAGIVATEDILARAAAESEKSLVIALISGGGSALMVCPPPGCSLEDIQQTSSALLASGASIHEINTIRKHLSRVSAGRLAAAAYPAPTIAFVLSDVIGDPLHVIASGPTVGDTSTLQQCQHIISKYGLHHCLPASVLHHLQSERNETPKLSDERLQRSHAIVVGSNTLALSAAEETLKATGYNTYILSTCMEGEAKELGIFYSCLAKSMLKSTTFSRPAALLCGGEPTVSFKQCGKGGRSQELALSFAVHSFCGDTRMEENETTHFTFCAYSTDGTDGPTDAAGAIVDAHSFGTADLQQKAIDALKAHDSYTFFAALHDRSHIITGPTNTNVMDVHILLCD